MPEGDLHFERRVLLYQILRRAFGDEVLVSSDQFVYFDPTDPKKCLSPDVGFRTGTRQQRLPIWKTWELGAPHVGVELVSPSDRSRVRDLETKLERYRQAGINELVRFDSENPKSPLRFWDLLEGDLVERDLTDPQAHRCDALGLYWCVCEHPELSIVLRLARDAAGTDLLLSPEEELVRSTQAVAAEAAAKVAATAATDAAIAEKDAALARIAELEAELARRR